MRTRAGYTAIEDVNPFGVQQGDGQASRYLATPASKHKFSHLLVIHDREYRIRDQYRQSDSFIGEHCVHFDS